MATRATEGAAQAQEDDAARRARAREMIRILDAWLADESGYDEETWPKLAPWLC